MRDGIARNWETLARSGGLDALLLTSDHFYQTDFTRPLLFLDDGNIEATNNRRERELRRLVLGRKNWLFTWLDLGGKRTGAILTIIATCIAHDLNPRAYLHLVTKLIVQGWPNAKLRDLLPDRILQAHPELYAGDPDALPALMNAAVADA